MTAGKPSGGSALLEIMVAMTVLTIGLTGLAPLMVLGSRVRRQSLEQTEIQHLLVSQLETVRGHVQQASTCAAAMENGSQSVVLHGRESSLQWSVVPAEFEFCTTDSLVLITVTISLDGSESIMDSVSVYQYCTPSPF